MKEKFRMVKKSCGYDINSISDQGVSFVAHILVRKIIRKWRANEVPTTVVSLATQCSDGF